MQIRNMLQIDIEAVAQLEMECFSQPWSKQSLKESLEQPSYRFLVAEKEGQVIGYMGVMIVLDEADVTNVAVTSSYRHQGIGKALVSHMLNVCKQQGVTAMTLEVRESNKTAIRLYEKMGFASVGKRKNFYEKPAEDAVIMWNYSL